jgi:hypothetical protein
LNDSVSSWADVKIDAIFLPCVPSIHELMECLKTTYTYFIYIFSSELLSPIYYISYIVFYN